MQIGRTTIDHAIGERFTAYAARLVVTAADAHWLDAAAREATGYATSFIGCDAEAGVDHDLPPQHTPDQRPGKAILFFARSPEKLAAAVRNRTGQCLMTCPTTAVFDALPDASDRFSLGPWLGCFGDGYQRQLERHGRTGVAVPVMEGEFFCERSAGTLKAVAGGTLFIGDDQPHRALQAARAAADAAAAQGHAITPFPGGVCRAGSKAGSARYPALIASTHDAYCPTLRDRVDSRLPTSVQTLYEIVIDALSQSAMERAMQAALAAAVGQQPGWISTGSYGGRLGKQRIDLRELAKRIPPPEPS